jgi:pimeloyl-ACP methyl ester carboxylesterase
MKKWFIMAGSILGLVGLFFIGRAIRIAHFPLNIQPHEDWDSLVASLDAAQQSYFVEADDGTLLEADLYIPNGGADLKGAVVFSPGSGDSLYQNYSPDFIETYIFDVYLPRDTAVLLVNKRGMGQSGGSWYKNDIQGRADDLYAAVRSLHDHPAIDPARIGAVGHSQGGWVVQLVAAQHEDVAYFISLSGPTYTIETNSQDNKWHLNYCNGYRGAELEQKTEQQMKLSRFGARAGEVVPFGMFGFDARSFPYDPWEALTSVQSPGLLVYAEYDNLVTPAWALDRLDEMFDGDLPDNLSTVTITDANHGFQIVDGLCEYIEAGRPLTPDLAVTMNDWLTAQGF